jgi:hypothetical protein
MGSAPPPGVRPVFLGLLAAGLKPSPFQAFARLG